MQGRTKITPEQRISRLEGAYEQVDARLHDMAQSIQALRTEMHNRMNTLTAIVVGSWITLALGIIGLYFIR